MIRENEIEKALAVLQNSDRILALTGAGVSAESGVPTFRGGGGTIVWRGMPFEELSSAKMVDKDLPLVWEWFDYRRGIIEKCEPNAGHLAIAEAQKSGRFEDFTLVTQNIDGLHALSGNCTVIFIKLGVPRAETYKIWPTLMATRGRTFARIASIRCGPMSSCSASRSTRTFC